MSEDWQQRVWDEIEHSEHEPARRTTVMCWITIAVLVAFVGLHIWAAIRFGCGASGLDPFGAAVAIASSGAGWTAWFATMLWLTRKQK